MQTKELTHFHSWWKKQRWPLKKHMYDKVWIDALSFLQYKVAVTTMTGSGNKVDQA